MDALMTNRDEDQQRHIDDAVRELARRLKLVSNLKDPEAAALDYLMWLRDRHWRVIPRAASWRDLHDQKPADPASNTEWREAKAAITRKREQ